MVRAKSLEDITDKMGFKVAPEKQKTGIEAPLRGETVDHRSRR